MGGRVVAVMGPGTVPERGSAKPVTQEMAPVEQALAAAGRESEPVMDRVPAEAAAVQAVPGTVLVRDRATPEKAADRVPAEMVGLEKAPVQDPAEAVPAAEQVELAVRVPGELVPVATATCCFNSWK